VDRPYRWALAGIAAAVAVGAIVAIVVIARDENHLQVQTADVTSGPIARRVLVSGALEPARMVEVGSQVSGTIASLPVDFSSRVKAGQVIARLDPALFETRLAEAEAGLARAQAERTSRLAALDDARRKLENAQALADDQQLPRAELDLARTAMLQGSADVKGAEADIAAARAMVTEARLNLDRTIIRSPIDGAVIGRHVDVGQTIVASVQAPTLFTIGDMRHMRLFAEVSEGEVAGVQRGSQVSFDIESIGGRAFTGTVADVRLSPQVAPATATNAGATSTPAPAGISSSTPVATNGTTPPAGSPASGTTAPPGVQATSSSPATPATPTTSTQQTAATIGVVTYIAVIDVDAAIQDIPPGSTAIVTLAGSERTQAVRIPNNSLTFAPSAASFAAVDQEPPVLSRPDSDSRKRPGTRKGHVWKFENNRFVPIPVETGIADDSWTELVSGDVRPGDRLVTAAVPLVRGRPLQ
jgi:RND family efflux transporter MFP subunit